MSAYFYVKTLTPLGSIERKRYFGMGGVTKFKKLLKQAPGGRIKKRPSLYRRPFFNILQFSAVYNRMLSAFPQSPRIPRCSGELCQTISIPTHAL